MPSVFDMGSDLIALICVGLMTLVTMVLVPMLRASLKAIVRDNTVAMEDLRDTLKEIQMELREHRDRLTTLDVKAEMKRP